MRRVCLQQLRIENFKGLSSCSFDFGKVFTRVKGANGTGKTTLLDAYLWVLTGKDSSGSESFKVQPVDQNNVTLPKVVTRVDVLLNVDGTEVTFTRQLSQKWSKPRGTNEEVLKGNESTYYVDGVPMTQTEYYAKLKEILCEQDDFKMMSSVSSFFALTVNEKRRKLMEMAGEMPDILTEEAFPNLYKRYRVAKSVEGVKKAANLALSELKRRMDEIPSKMSENERNMPTGIDFEALRKEEKEIRERIEDIDSALQMDSTAKTRKYETVNAVNRERFEVIASMNAIEMKYRMCSSSYLDDYNAGLKKLNDELRDLQASLDSARVRLAGAEKNVAVYTEKVGELGSQWRKVNEEQFDGTVEETCPVCRRPFSREELNEAMNELVKAFNKGKVAKLEAIVKLGTNAREVLDQEKASLKGHQDAVSLYSARISELELTIETYMSSAPVAPDYMEEALKDGEYIRLSDRLKEVEGRLEALSVDDGDSTGAELMKREKSELSARLRAVISELSKENMIELVNARREELKEEARRISVDIAAQEQVLYEIRQYIKSHITMVEDKVSSMFSMVRFQMYEPNLTNDGEKEICECLVNGVPYSSNLNSASRVNAGIDMVNAISEWKGMYVPLFIDNKETVSSLLASRTQIITLEVAEGSLRIS